MFILLKILFVFPLVSAKKLKNKLIHVTEVDTERKNKVKIIRKLKGAGDSSSLQKVRKENKTEDQSVFEPEGQTTLLKKEATHKDTDKNIKKVTDETSRCKEEKNNEIINNKASKDEDNNTENAKSYISNKFYRFMSWTLKAAYSFETSNSENFLNTLSKNLTKQKTKI